MQMRKDLKNIVVAAGLGLLAIGASSVRAALVDNAVSTGDDTLFQGNVTGSLGDP
jgi:hypothetical protein